MESYMCDFKLSRPAKINSDFKLKFKTEICRNWKKGCCEFGRNCSFAHGVHELRDQTNFCPSKLKQCKPFYETGYCQYGARCQFIHNSSSEETSESSPTIVVKETTDYKAKKRLPIFLKISSQGSDSGNC